MLYGSEFTRRTTEHTVLPFYKKRTKSLARIRQLESLILAMGCRSRATSLIQQSDIQICTRL